MQRFFRLHIRQKRTLISISKQNQNPEYFTQLHIEYNTSKSAKGAKGENANVYEGIRMYKLFQGQCNILVYRFDYVNGAMSA